MRDHLAHRYFDTNHAVLQATVDNDLPELERAVQALAETLPVEEQQDEDPRACVGPKFATPGGGKCSGSVFQIPVPLGLDLAALRSITKAVQAASEGNDQ